MTDDEFNHLAALYGFAPSKPLREMLDAAVKAEREACAKRLKDIANQISDEQRTGFVYKTVELCVDAIRERSKK